MFKDKSNLWTKNSTGSMLGPQNEDGEKIGLDSFTLYRTSIVRGRLQAKFHILRKFFDCLTAYLKGNMILSKFPLDQSSSTLKETCYQFLPQTEI